MATSTAKYFEAVGRRKTSSARARISEASKASFEVNDKDLATYFGTATLQQKASEALLKAGEAQKFAVTVKVQGGGIASQSEAVRHAISRALLKYDHNLRSDLKKEGFLKRDPRVKERRKFGLKKARKAPQWSKR